MSLVFPKSRTKSRPRCSQLGLPSPLLTLRGRAQFGAMLDLDRIFILVWCAIVAGACLYVRILYDTTFDELALFVVAFSNLASLAHRFLDPLCMTFGFKAAGCFSQSLRVRRDIKWGERTKRRGGERPQVPFGGGERRRRTAEANGLKSRLTKKLNSAQNQFDTAASRFREYEKMSMASRTEVVQKFLHDATHAGRPSQIASHAENTAQLLEEP
eukprot:2369101-Prymnesium_polylepis.2